MSRPILSLALALCLVAGLALGGAAVAPTRAAAATTPTATVSSSSIPLGGTVTVGGGGFAPSEIVTVLLYPAGVGLGAIQADASGTLAPTAMTIPALRTVGQSMLPVSPGTYSLVLTGSSSARSASVQITLVPSLTTSAPSAALGGQVALSGAGFAAGEQVRVSLSQDPQTLATLPADGNGLVALTAVTMPTTFGSGTGTLAISPGMHTLTLTGASSGRTASATLTLLPAVSVSPLTVPQGGSTALSAAGFAAHEQVRVTLSGQTEPLVTLTADGNGLVALTDVTIPPTLAPGAHTLTLTGASSGRTASATLTLTVATAAALSTATIPLGGQVAISATGFGANEQVSVALSQVPGTVATLTANGMGVIVPTAVTIPTTYVAAGATLAVSPGAHTLTLSGTSSGHTVTLQLTLVPAATVSASTVGLGGTLALAGAGFAAHEQVSVAVSQDPATLATLTADGNGLVALTTITIPTTFKVGDQLRALSPGAHTLTLSGLSSGRSATVALTLVPSASLSSPTVGLGDQVTVTGTGFAAAEEVSVSLSQWPGTLTTLHADGNGLVGPAALTIPTTLSQGAHTLTLHGSASGRSASLQVTLGPAVAPAVLEVAPSSTNRGGLITVSGSGFAPYAVVRLSIDGLEAPLGTITADAQGRLAATGVGIPYQATVGAHTLRATGTRSGRTATTALTIAALSPTLTLSQASVQAGDTLTVRGAGFGRQERVTLALNGVALATPAIVTDRGAFSVQVTVPGSLLRGANTISAEGADSRVSAAVTLSGTPVVATTLYIAGISTGQPASAGPRPVGAPQWRLQVGMYLRPTAAAFPTGRVLVPAGQTVREWGPQPGSGWRHITWQGHDGYLLTSNMALVGASTPAQPEQATLAVLNPAAQPAHLDLTFYYQNGTPGRARLTVPAHSRGTADLGALAGEQRTFGLKLTADRVVSAQVLLTRPGKDGSALLGVAAPATTWYVAEGYTGGDFRETLALLNPGDQTAQVQVQFLPSAGRAAHSVSVTVRPQSTALLAANAVVSGQPVGVEATSSRPIVLARAITFGPQGYGLMAQVGSTTPATSWIFAHGAATADQETVLSVLNPQREGYAVTATFYDPTGATLGSRTFYVPQRGRASIKLNRFLSGPAIATVLSSPVPVVAEETLYLHGTGGATSASVVAGRNGASLRWSFPGGDAAAGSETLYLFNPSGQTAQIDVTVYGSDGQTLRRQVTVAPDGQGVFDVAALGGAITPQHALTVQAVNGVGVVAEKANVGPGRSALHSTQGVAS